LRILFRISNPGSVRQAVSKEKKPIPGFVNPLMRAMILLNEVSKILHLSQLAAFGETSFCFQFSKGFGRGCIFVDVNDSWLAAMRSSKGFEEEAPGGFRVSGRAEQDGERGSDVESTARERETHSFLTLMEVSSTRQESVVGFKWARQRRSSSGAEC
jgi:hypothetical protein